jgi:orotidine-5'-phosphate decarboxylase
VGLPLESVVLAKSIEVEDAMRGTFQTLCTAAWASTKHVCVGLDIDPNRIPLSVRGNTTERVVSFAREVVEATADLAGAYKPNTAFFEALGSAGPEVLASICEHVRDVAPQSVLIIDAKRADIANTNAGSVTYVFDFLGGDAITIHPYLGQEAVRPFLDRDDRGVFVLCRTSNPRAGEFQDLEVGGTPLYMHVAKSVDQSWNAMGNCGLVVGATHPDELRRVRDAVPDLPLLIPGVGAQGGDLESTVRAACANRSLHAFVNASRSIIYASDGRDFGEAARVEAQSMSATIERVIRALA